MPFQVARNHLGLIAAMLAAAGLAWWWTVERMAGMSASPGTDLGTLGWFTGSWVVMMAAMMLPSFAPSVAAYVSLTHVGRPSRSMLFACGYLLAWTIAGVVTYALIELGKDQLGGGLAWHSAGRWLCGGILALAALYQFTPFKHAYLTRCRARFDAVNDEARGLRASLVMGLRNGGWCIGCCWALMAALFALGVMSLTWMAVIALLVALEKTSPRAITARMATASVLAALAVGVLAAPDQVPGLAVPGPSAMHAMKAMG